MIMPMCTLELFLDGRWQSVATLELLAGVERGTESETRVAYLIEHVLAAQGKRDAAALSARLPVSLDFMRLPTWPAFAVDLLPQGYGRQELARRLDIPVSARQSDWSLLMAGAGNPVGNLRVAEAAAYVRQHGAGSSRGFSYEEIVSRADTFMEYLATQGYFIAGSSGVQGEWPKILLTQDKAGYWHLDHLLSDEDAVAHWIVKLARGDNPVFKLILAVEAAYYAIAAEMGLRVGQALCHDHGVLFIPRFDRAVTATGVLRIGQESLYSLTGRAGFEVALSHNQAVAAIAAYCTNPQADIIEYVLRDALNIALGNKDNHGRNSAFQRFADGCIVLAPLFDFAPMFLHPEGIARRMRWERDDAGNPDWISVAGQAAAAGNLPVEVLRQHMGEFAIAVARLPTALLRHAVPVELVDRLRQGITATAQGLEAARHG